MTTDLRRTLGKQGEYTGKVGFLVPYFPRLH